MEVQFLKEVRRFLVSFDIYSRAENNFFFRQYWRKTSVSMFTRVRGLGDSLVVLTHFDLNGLYSVYKGNYFLLSAMKRQSKICQYKLILNYSDIESILNRKVGKYIGQGDKKGLQYLCRLIFEKVECQRKLVYQGLVIPMNNLSILPEKKNYVLYNNF
jgi:hypothetical protein